MTTRKQKHEQAVEKRARFLEEQKRSGLEAQRIDREYREEQLRRATEEKHNKEHSWRKLHKDCPHCDDLLAAQAYQRRMLEAAVYG